MHEDLGFLEMEFDAAGLGVGEEVHVEEDVLPPLLAEGDDAVLSLKEIRKWKERMERIQDRSVLLLHYTCYPVQS